ncbi:unnamed protein product [Anisakis simplex]|uniref:Thyroglobulin type-1 domain-containing protein n=1 Tax=Anisakis simplex TaxID=6269 RepID=A0A0M3K958_ANISI|nr:unnamed protein product [Anisakis simplex]
MFYRWTTSPIEDEAAADDPNGNAIARESEPCAAYSSQSLVLKCPCDGERMTSQEKLKVEINQQQCAIGQNQQILA